MHFRHKLQSPFALALQGFVVGAFLFFVLHPLASTGPAPARAAGESVLADLQA
ncbi:MAG TPA: hypothetical protein VGX37_05540 [Allosphingosinicella sp.]|jgi:uncharacterized membrane protein YdcZ (DUF606 family)|nr:hypothetical protein [Allosphingosinicella sp.]